MISVAADDHLADGLHVARDVVHLQIDHADLAARERPAGHRLTAVGDRPRPRK